MGQSMLTLRPYQTKHMVAPAVEAFKNGSRSVVVVGSTGSGKTAVAAWWAQQAQKKNRNVLTICHKQIIQKQLRKTFLDFGVVTDEVSSGKKIYGHKIQVARIQSLINRLDSIPVPDWIIGDEAHHFAVDNMWGRAVQYYREKNPDLKTILLTATPNGLTSGRGLHPFADTMISELSLKYLVDEGWLVYPHMMRGEKIETPKFHITAGDYDKKEQKEYFSKPKIIGSAVDNYRQYMDGEPSIVSCVSLDHAHFVQEQYTKAAREKGKSWKFVMIQGGKKYEKQMFDAIAGLATGSVQGLCFVDVLGEGLDIPSCTGLQMLRKMNSYVFYKQIGGRTLRPVWPEGFNQYRSTATERLKVIRQSVKPKAIIHDFAENFDQHKHLLNDPEWTLEDTKGKGMKTNTLVMPPVSVCPKCTGVWPGLPRLCPDCGYNLQEDRDRKEGRKPPKEIEGILREVMPGDVQESVQFAIKLQAMKPSQRNAIMTGLYHHEGKTDRVKGLIKVLGYKSGWYYMADKRKRK